jgi:hypothetical protein
LGGGVLAACCLAGLASAAAAKGAFERAARLWGAVEALKSDDVTIVLHPPEEARYEWRVQAACESEPAALAAGRELDLEQAVELALHP